MSETRRRVAVVTPDLVQPMMAGPAIRAWHIATTLAQEHDVRLVSIAGCTSTSPSFATATMTTQEESAELAEWAEVSVVQGDVLDKFPRLASTRGVVVCDMYDPFHLEQLEQTAGFPDDARRVIVRNARASAIRQLLRGDFFLCASAQQRSFWLGHLAAIGRLNTLTYDADPTARQLLAVVPFGLPETPPTSTGPVIRGVVPGIDQDDQVILWGGGIYDWFDPLTLVEAVGRLRARHPRLRLFFLGVRHPHPDVGEPAAVAATRVRATELGLLGTHVFLNEGWVPYDQRGAYLLEADLGVSTHFEHLETAFAFRTRILDYLWAGLPVVTTRGDTLGELVERRGLGVAVPSRDVDALASALDSLLSDPTAAAACRARVEVVAAEYTWTRVLAPLVEFCREPRRAPDLLDPRTVRALRRTGAALLPVSGWRGDVEIAVGHWQSGGARHVAAKAAARLRRLRRLLGLG